MGETEFRAEVDHSGGRPVVRVAGEVDVLTEGLMWRALERALAASPNVVVDLGHVTFFGSNGLGMLVRAHNRVAREHGSITLRAPSDHVTKVLRITALDQVFPVEPAAPAADH